jgi:hypothetical protein
LFFAAIIVVIAPISSRDVKADCADPPTVDAASLCNYLLGNANEPGEVAVPVGRGVVEKGSDA